MNALVDTNILVGMSDTHSARCQVCHQAVATLVRQRDAVVLCAQAVIEYWVVATRPRKNNGLGLTPTQAEAELRDFERLLGWYPEPSDIGDRWRKLVNRYAVIGKPAHDTRLVAFMEAHGLTHLLTLNTADFTRYTTITALHPNDVR